MARRKFIYDPETKEMVEVSPDYQPEPKDRSDLLWNDRSYDGLKATDGTPIDSRAKHRAYMKLHGVTTVDDFKGTWERAQAARERYYTRGGTVTKDDIGRVIHQLEQRQRRG